MQLESGERHNLCGVKVGCHRRHVKAVDSRWLALVTFPIRPKTPRSSVYICPVSTDLYTYCHSICDLYTPLLRDTREDRTAIHYTPLEHYTHRRQDVQGFQG